MLDSNDYRYFNDFIELSKRFRTNKNSNHSYHKYEQD